MRSATKFTLYVTCIANVICAPYTSFIFVFMWWMIVPFPILVLFVRLISVIGICTTQPFMDVDGGCKNTTRGGRCILYWSNLHLILWCCNQSDGEFFEYLQIKKQICSIFTKEEKIKLSHFILLFCTYLYFITEIMKDELVLQTE